jgi:hypothetical protein
MLLRKQLSLFTKMSEGRYKIRDEACIHFLTFAETSSLFNLSAIAGRGLFVLS